MVRATMDSLTIPIEIGVLIWLVLASRGMLENRAAREPMAPAARRLGLAWLAYLALFAFSRTYTVGLSGRLWQFALHVCLGLLFVAYGLFQGHGARRKQERSSQRP